MRFFLQVSQLLSLADQVGKPYSPNLHKNHTAIRYLKVMSQQQHTAMLVTSFTNHCTSDETNIGVKNYQGK